jgi:adenylate cyclase
MKAITHCEVYVVKLGRWTLHARLSESEQTQAVEIARTLEADTGRPTQVLEEMLEPEHERLTIRIVAQYGQAPPETKGPSTDTDMTSRVFMVGLNAFGIGAIVTMLMAIALSSFRESGAAAGNSFNMLLLFTFSATVLMAGLALVKIYIPVEWILWRGKGAESQRRTIDALLHSVRETAPKWQPPPVEPPPVVASVPEPEAPPALTPDEQISSTPVQRMETNADQGEQTSFQIDAAPAATDPLPPTEAAPESLIESASAVMDSLLEKERAQLIAFADTSLAALTASRPQLQAFEHVGLNLYLGGAAIALTERAGFPDTVKLDLLRKTLEHTGTNASIADAFAQRLEISAQRPRFRQLIDAGRAAMTAVLDGITNASLPALPDLIQQWADPTVRGAEIKKVTFLLTDIVGSTALTSKLGNSAAQRVVRAHNAAVRTAAKNFRGTEVKHTGDGILLTFPDAAAASRAAIEIQQEGTAYAGDNPDAPLMMRIGIHTGEASFEEGEYYGPALGILNGVCAAAGDNQIFCSEEAKNRSVGPAFRFQDMGKRKLKGAQIDAQLFKLDWTPKIKAVKGPLEYTQIGKTPIATP